MARNGETGSFYTTDDLIRMSRLESFGQYSSMLERVFIKFKIYEAENKQLKTLVTQLKEELEARAEGHTVEKLL
jgi:hypothetical protein